MPTSTEYEKKYQNQYYKKVTKIKRKLKSIQRKAEIEKEKLLLTEQPREVTYTCPICNKVFKELSSSIKPKKHKTCRECKLKILRERAKLPKIREKMNARRACDSLYNET